MEQKLTNTWLDLQTRLKKLIVPVTLIAILVGIGGALFERKKATKYAVSSKIFPLSNSGSSGPMDAIKAQLGISDASDLSKIYNISELINSKTLSQNISNSVVHNKYNKLALWLIDDYNNKTKSLFDKKIEIKKLDSLDIVITGSDFVAANTSISTSKTDFTTITTSSGTPELSIQLNKAILAELSNFYIRSKTEKARADIYRLERLKDSIKENLNNIEKAMAGNLDASRYVVESSASLPQIKLERLHEEVEEQYKAVAIALQNANFKLLSESPIFQILDQPIKPIIEERPKWKKMFVLSFFMSFFFLMLIGLRQLIWRLVLNEIKKV